ncbi:NUDIX hydrolase [Candidatus Solincola tengchongensis]|uniref:NUDIX domain-containing protein n=1 Tax=Candidatus Solincola tengchongensis TaxID=2900693 RepID=UPI0025794AA5|nr:NUDIX hydrolase [Candidatus Solincola tengchongensis]
MEGHGHRLLERRTVFEGKVVRLYLDRVRLPDGREAEREVVLHWGAVGMVPVDGEGKVVLVRQYRHATGEALLEIPAGKLTPEEEPLSCAERELMEEVGYRAGRWVHLASFYTSPGFSNEMLHLYLALDLEEGEASPEEDEFLEVASVPLGHALELVKRGEIKDSKTVAGLALAALHLEGRYA